MLYQSCWFFLSFYIFFFKHHKIHRLIFTYYIFFIHLSLSLSLSFSSTYFAGFQVCLNNYTKCLTNERRIKHGNYKVYGILQKCVWISQIKQKTLFSTICILMLISNTLITVVVAVVLFLLFFYTLNFPFLGKKKKKKRPLSQTNLLGK